MIKTKEDWINAGFEVLSDKGISSVKIEYLARRLGVTKGSFYGYFLNRDAFLQAMLDYWENIYTTEIFKTINPLKGNLTVKLKKLLYMVDDSKYDAMETSMHNWAIHDPSAKKVVMRVVSRRLVWCKGLFIEGGFPEDEAEKRGILMHHYMSGCKTFRSLLPKSGSPERHEQLDHFIRLITAPVD